MDLPLPSGGFLLCPAGRCSWNGLWGVVAGALLWTGCLATVMEFCEREGDAYTCHTRVCTMVSLSRRRTPASCAQAGG